MIERLIRICLAFAIAIVFTGRMEAAAEHCARLVAQEQAVAKPQHDAAPCHGAVAEDVFQQTSHHPAPQDPLQGQCECIAVLVGFASFAAPLASVRVEPYDWMLPQPAAFASVEPALALRPPRA
jgi:hypothetical protein